MPGSVASGTCSPSNTRCSYTSSVTTSRSCSMHELGDRRRARRVRSTLPVGLCGELSRISFVRGVIAARELVGIEASSRACAACTTRRVAPGHRDARGVRVVVRLERDDLVARLAQREQRGRDRLGRARGDEHLGVGVEVEAVEALLVRRRSRARSSGTPMPGRVLVVAGADRVDRGLLHDVGAVGVGEPLPEVDRARSRPRAPTSRRRSSCRSPAGATRDTGRVRSLPAP